MRLIGNVQIARRIAAVNDVFINQNAGGFVRQVKGQRIRLLVIGIGVQAAVNLRPKVIFLIRVVMVQMHLARLQFCSCRIANCQPVPHRNVVQARSQVFSASVDDDAVLHGIGPDCVALSILHRLAIRVVLR